MSAELGFLRTVERGLIAALGWFPYSDELPDPDAMIETWKVDYEALTRALECVRERKAIVERTVLDTAAGE